MFGGIDFICLWDLDGEGYFYLFLCVVVEFCDLCDDLVECWIDEVVELDFDDWLVVVEGQIYCCVYDFGFCEWSVDYVCGVEFVEEFVGDVEDVVELVDVFFQQDDFVIVLYCMVEFGVECFFESYFGYVYILFLNVVRYVVYFVC